jgi:hypothetical protein
MAEEHRRRAILGILAAGVAVTERAAAAETKKPKPNDGVLTVSEYLHRAALLLDETRRAHDWIAQHPWDLGLAAMAFDLAELRSTLAARISAPAQAKQAHMHLMLVLENTAAAFDARVRGDDKKAAQRLAAARSETRTLEAALEAAKLKIPAMK